MSRSYRKPYSTVCSAKKSARQDKVIAARCLRRLQNRYLRLNWKDENFLLPVRYEASHNDVWGWNRDGKQRLQFEPVFESLRFCSYYWLTEDEQLERALENFERNKEWFAYLKRK